MKCLFDSEIECPLSGQNIPVLKLANFCSPCTGRREFQKMNESIKMMKAQMILAVMSMFPKDEEEAMRQYRLLLKRVEEW